MTQANAIIKNAQPNFMPGLANKSEIVQEKNKGLQFNAYLGGNNQSKNLSKMMTQNAGEQITFAQKILLQQLKNQFPGNEFDATKMVESLMGMMQIAQHSQLNETQQKSLDLNIAMMNQQLSSLAGKYVEQRSDTFDYRYGEQKVVYTLPAQGKEAIAVVYADGEERPLFAQQVEAEQGLNTFVWDGTNQNGEQMPAGLYNIFIRAKDGDNNDIPVDMLLHTQITDIDYTQGPLGIPYAGRVPLFNFNKLLAQTQPLLKTVDSQNSPQTLLLHPDMQAVNHTTVPSTTA